VLVLAHILGVPFEELITASGMTVGAFAFLVIALTSRTKRR
jgi:hypothetical protein